MKIVPTLYSSLSVAALTLSAGSGLALMTRPVEAADTPHRAAQEGTPRPVTGPYGGSGTAPAAPDLPGTLPLKARTTAQEVPR